MGGKEGDRGFAYWNLNGTSMKELMRRHGERIQDDPPEPEGELLTGEELLDRLWGRGPEEPDA